MKFNLVNSTKIAALLVPLLMLLLVPTVSAQSETAQSEAGQVYVQLNVAKLGQSESGKIVADSLLQIPYVKEQLNSIPANLVFLKEAKLETITLQVTGDEQSEHVVFDIAGKFDSSKLFALLSRGNGYAKVQYDGIDVHHWVTDLKSLGDQVMGAEADENPLNEEPSDPVYLALPSSNRLLVSTSLAKLTETLSSPGRTLATKPEQFARFGNGNNLLALHIDVPGMDMPGELTAVLREDDSAKLQVLATLDSRNDAEQQVAVMIDSLLKDPKAASQMLGIGPVAKNANALPRKQPERKVAMELESATDKPEHENKLSLGLALNSGTLDPKDWKVTIERFLTDCVKCQHANDRLTLEVNLFLGPCKVTNIAKDSKQGIARGQTMNEMNLVFNAYTTAEEREAGKRVAAKPSSETNRR